MEYPLDAVYHKVLVYLNERVASPYGSFYIIDHPSWDDILTIDVPLIGLHQLEDLHGYLSEDQRLYPHPSHYPQSRANWNFYPTRIATNQAA